MSKQSSVFFVVCFGIVFGQLEDSDPKGKIMVTSILVDPFLMVLDDPALHGNERYEGFSKDFADKLFEKLGFDYEINIVRDGTYGTKNSTHHMWGGMIGELISDVAHVAIADLTMTSIRSEVLDFSIPFMHAQLAILLKKSNLTDTIFDAPVFSLLSRQFSTELWLAIAVTIITYTLLIIVVHNSVGRNVHKIYPKWMQKPLSSQCIEFSLVMFIFIILAIMTSNFVASKVATTILQSESITEPLSVNSAEELVEQDNIKFGILKTGATYNYFESAMSDEVIEKMYSKMSAQNTFVSSYKEGVSRVRNSNGSAAFIMESHAAEYATIKKPCDVTVVPKLFGPHRGFSVAIPKGSTRLLMKDIDLAILDLNEEGVLMDLENKWFKDQTECDDTSRDILEINNLTSNTISIEQVATVFIGLAVAIFVIIISAVVEYIYVQRSI